MQITNRIAQATLAANKPYEDFFTPCKSDDSTWSSPFSMFFHFEAKASQRILKEITPIYQSVWRSCRIAVYERLNADNIRTQGIEAAEKVTCPSQVIWGQDDKARSPDLSVSHDKYSFPSPFRGHISTRARVEYFLSTIETDCLRLHSLYKLFHSLFINMTISLSTTLNAPWHLPLAFSPPPNTQVLCDTHTHTLNVPLPATRWCT